MQMPDNEESRVDTNMMSKEASEEDDPTSEEIAALASSFMDPDINSPDNDDDWKDFKVALWDSLTSGPDDKSHSNGNATFVKSHESSSAQASSPTNTIRGQVNEGAEHGNSSSENTPLFYAGDATSDFVDLSGKPSYLPDLLKMLNKNDIKLLTDKESQTTQIQFRGKEYILSNGPQKNVDPFADVLTDSFDYFGSENRGHNEDGRPATSEKLESHEDIFKVWDLGLPNEENEFTRQLKALALSSPDPSTQNPTMDSIDEMLYASTLKDDGDGYVDTSASSEDYNSNLNETNIDELIQGITEMSLNLS